MLVKYGIHVRTIKSVVAKLTDPAPDGRLEGYYWPASSRKDAEKETSSTITKPSQKHQHLPRLHTYIITETKDVPANPSPCPISIPRPVRDKSDRQTDRQIAGPQGDRGGHMVKFASKPNQPEAPPP